MNRHRTRWTEPAPRDPRAGRGPLPFPSAPCALFGLTIFALSQIASPAQTLTNAAQVLAMPEFDYLKPKPARDLKRALAALFAAIA